MIVNRYDVLGSTNLRLMEMAEEKAAPWTVVMADRQEGGVGRSGRTWWSPQGGLYMSVLLKPEITASRLPRIPILASLAVLDALGDKDASLRVKWPNDILTGDRKLAGILIQAKIKREDVLWVVAGFGINVHRPETPPPEEIRDRIAFAEELSSGIVKDLLAEDIAARLRERVEMPDDGSWKKAVEEWSKSASWKGIYTHRDGKRETRGVPVRLAEDGGLVLRTDRGEVTVHSGEIIEAVQSSSPFA